MDESLTKAVKFISGVLKDDPKFDKARLIELVSQKFDLNPLQTDFLVNKYL